MNTLMLASFVMKSQVRQADFDDPSNAVRRRLAPALRFVAVSLAVAVLAVLERAA